MNMKRQRTSSKLQSRGGSQRRDTKSAWALATPRFTEDPQGTGTMVTGTGGAGDKQESPPQTTALSDFRVRHHHRRHTNPNRPSSKSSSRSARRLSRFRDKLNGSDDEIGGSDTEEELILSPPKAKRLVGRIIGDAVDEEKSPCSYSDTSSLGLKNDFLEKEDDGEHFSDCDFHSIHSESIRGGQGRQDLLDPEFKHFPRKIDPLEYLGGERTHQNVQDARIEKLESQISRLEGEINRRDDDIAELRESQKKKDSKKMLAEEHEVELFKALEFSAQLLGYSNFGRNNTGRIQAFKERLEKEKKDEVKSIQDSHNEKLLSLKEEHKNDLIDLQDRMLQWMSSKVNLVNQQSEMICYLRKELNDLRAEYEELKETSVEAFDKATQSIATNCTTLKSYVKEEISEAEKESKRTIDNLRAELESAQRKIASLEAIPEDSRVKHQSSISSLESTNPTGRQRSGSMSSSWSQYTSKIRDALEGKLPPSDVSVDSKLDLYGTMAAEKMFKNLYFNTNSAQKRRSKKKKALSVHVPIPDSEFHDCKDNENEDSDDFVDAQS